MVTASAAHAFPAIAEGQSNRSTAQKLNGAKSAAVAPSSAAGPDYRPRPDLGGAASLLVHPVLNVDRRKRF